MLRVEINNGSVLELVAIYPLYTNKYTIKGKKYKKSDEVKTSDCIAHLTQSIPLFLYEIANKNDLKSIIIEVEEFGEEKKNKNFKVEIPLNKITNYSYELEDFEFIKPSYIEIKTSDSKNIHIISDYEEAYNFRFYFYLKFTKGNPIFITSHGGSIYNVLTNPDKIFQTKTKLSKFDWDDVSILGKVGD